MTTIERPRWLTPGLLNDPWRTIEATLPWSDPQAQPLRDIAAACRDLMMRTGWEARHVLMSPQEMSNLMTCDEVVQRLHIYGQGQASIGGVLTDINGVTVHLDDTSILPGHYKRTLFLMDGEALVANEYPRGPDRPWCPDAPPSCVIIRGLTRAGNLRLRRC